MNQEIIAARELLKELKEKTEKTEKMKRAVLLEIALTKPRSQIEVTQ